MRVVRALAGPNVETSRLSTDERYGRTSLERHLQQEEAEWHGGWEDKLPMFIKATGKGPAGTKGKAKASEKLPARQASRRTAASSGKRAKPMYRVAS